MVLAQVEPKYCDRVEAAALIAIVTMKGNSLRGHELPKRVRRICAMFNQVR